MKDLNKRLDAIEAALKGDPQAREYPRILAALSLKLAARELAEPLPDEAAFIEGVAWARVQEAVGAIGSRTGFVDRFAAAMYAAAKQVPPTEVERRARARVAFDQALAGLRRFGEKA